VILMPPSIPGSICPTLRTGVGRRAGSIDLMGR
jgi:hypothetical protein